MDNNNVAGDSNLPDFWARNFILELESSEKLVGLIEKKVAEHLPRKDKSRSEEAAGLIHALSCERKRMDWLMKDLILPNQTLLPAGKS